MDKTNVRIVTLLAIGALPFLPTACDGSNPNRRSGDTISMDEFVNAYFELRSAALTTREMELTLDRRDSVLAKLELTEEDLLGFVDRWGADGDVMLSAWEQVDSLMRDARSRGGPEHQEGDEEPGGIDPERESGRRGGVGGP